MTRATPGRNDPCPCGSGRKYKRCHGQAPAASPSALDLEALLALLGERRWQDLETGAAEALRREPGNGMLCKLLCVAMARQGKDALPMLKRAATLLPADAEAQRNLGMTLRDQGQWREALPSLERALQLEPGAAVTWCAVGSVYAGLGEPAQARSLFVRALELRPDYPEALFRAAALAASTGEWREAVEWGRRLTQLEPTNSAAHNNLGNALHTLQRYEEAVGCYLSATQLEPQNARIRSNLANAFREAGQLESAMRSAREACSLDDRLADAHNSLGLALAAQGDFESAAGKFNLALELEPHHLDALNNLGSVLRDLGNRRQSLAHFMQAVSLAPADALSLRNLGNAQFEAQEFDAARHTYLRALVSSPGDAAARTSLSMVLRAQGRAREAEITCHEALAINPDSVEALALLGDLRADRGQFEQAQTLFERALSLDPAFPFPYLSIAMHRRMRKDDVQWLAGVRALTARRLPLRHEISLRYALGKFYDDTCDYGAAFAEYRLANELSKRGRPRYDAAGMSHRIDHLIAGPEAPRPAWPGNPSERPVLIVGMPRSGTSLAEQIIASHPDAYGAGELPFWDGAADALDAGVSLEQLATRYLDQLATIAPGPARIVDKMPPNFMHLALFHAAFPRARIVHMRRHPIDTCVSVYFQYFQSSHPFANDLESLAHYYRQYARLSDHWRRVLPADRYLEVPYEALTADQELWSRRMLQFIGLPWDARCLDFHATERTVITASKWQVRQKIHRKSAGRWRNYEAFVTPLLALLDLVAE